MSGNGNVTKKNSTLLNEYNSDLQVNEVLVCLQNCALKTHGPMSIRSVSRDDEQYLPNARLSPLSIQTTSTKKTEKLPSLMPDTYLLENIFKL